MNTSLFRFPDHPEPFRDDVEERIRLRLGEADPEKLEEILSLLEESRAFQPVEKATGPSGQRILVVDDDPDVARYIRALLVDAGYPVQTASSTSEALALARAKPPALVTLDLDLPGSSGLRLYRDIKADPALANVPVIVITGLTQDLEPLFTGHDSVPDVDGYIEKPFDPKALFSAVKEAIESRKT